MAKLDNSASDFPVIRVNNRFQEKDVTEDYYHRPVELENCSLYNFVEKFEVLGASTIKKKGKDQPLLFLNTHSSCDTKCVVKRLKLVIPDII